MLVYELPEEDYVLTEWTNLQRLSSIPVGGKQFFLSIKQNTAYWDQKRQYLVGLSVCLFSRISQQKYQVTRDMFPF